ncbi:hypothetical protein [Campylobacter fetus]|uniref:hypothetical protein n=1 Tax=Campylobacter fetus TaxID=196 RepID=UPI000FCCA990|nr:hypothetical protein [Campylobacter fetus]RUT49267.1 hypothetical protein BWK67_06810 [Campylobacter fetus]RUT49527.1 hypothetical protein BWK51_06790 [Campylobacter fetus]
MTEIFTNFWGYFLANLHGHIAFGVYSILLFGIIFLAGFLRYGKLYSQASSILITIGIAFTFFGIAYGLMTFDANNIEQSLPELINGIKTAFLVSLVGVSVAVCLKIFEFFAIPIFSKFNKNRYSKDLDGIELLKEQNILLEKINQKDDRQFITILQELKDSIVGDETSSLIGQIKNLRTDGNDNFNRLIIKFETFAKEMSQNNSKALIEALNEVIKDFNEKLTEQFGENFKELNKAVEKLVIWQDNYKIILEETQSKFEINAKHLDKVNENIQIQINDYAKVIKSSQIFEQVAQSLQDIIINISNQRDMLYKNIDDLGEFLAKNQDAMPKFAAQIDKFREESSKAISQINNLIVSTNQNFEKQSKQILENIDKMKISVETSIAGFTNQFTNTLNTQIKDFSAAVDRQNATLTSNLEEHNKRFNDQLIKGLNVSSAEIQNRVKTLDNELENAIRSVCQNLASISEKISKDYIAMKQINENRHNNAR